MIKIITAGALGFISVAIIVWAASKSVEPNAAATVTQADAAIVESPTNSINAAIVEGPASSPLELMIKHGKNLPAEQWDAF